MKESYYFKTKEDVVRYGMSPNLIYEDDPQCVPISEDEYNNAIIELETKVNVEENATPTYDELLAENEALEAENAALLFQVLTGEEFADV